VSTKPDELLADESPLSETDEFRALILAGQERGFLTFEQIADVSIAKDAVEKAGGRQTIGSCKD